MGPLIVADEPAPIPITGRGTTELLVMIERLEGLLMRSDLAELEVEVDGTSVRLQRPETVPGMDPAIVAVLSALLSGGGQPAASDAAVVGGDRAQHDEPAAGTGRHAILAPLTGVFYGSPAPDAEPYVVVGGQVSAGQVIGLIEAMKLFNEIKSDATGTVARIVAESGSLVKAKQPLLEVEPS